MMPAISEQTRERNRSYYEANKERIRAQAKSYAARPESMARRRETSKALRVAHRDELAAYRKAWDSAHRNTTAKQWNPDRYSKDAEGAWWYSSKNGHRERALELRCCGCGVSIVRRGVASMDVARATCSTRCRNDAQPWFDKSVGYIRMRDPRGGRWILQHRYVMELAIGRRLARHESVHHKNGDRTDNRIENLELWTRPQPRGIRAADARHCPSCTCESK